MKIFYVSPHYDDAVGSCGARISKDNLNNEVSLITVFSEVKEPFSTYANMLHDYWKLIDPINDRKNENINVCKYLNISNIMLRFLDAVYRTVNNDYIYPNQDSIFSEVSPLDLELVNKIKKELMTYITKEDLLYFPLSVGSHVDHVIVSEIGKVLKEENYQVRFYLEFSYDGKLPEICNTLKENRLKLDDQFINKKIEAMKLYKSQVNMLHEDETKIEEYYKSKLEGVETYYE